MKKSLFLLLVLFCVMQLSAQVPSNALLKVFDSVCRQSTPGKNFMFSPWGIQQCFGMAAEGAGKVSSKELEQILGISKDSAEKFHLAAQSLKNTQARFNSFNAILLTANILCKKILSTALSNIITASSTKSIFRAKQNVQNCSTALSGAKVTTCLIMYLLRRLWRVIRCWCCSMCCISKTTGKPGLIKKLPGSKNSSSWQIKTLRRSR